MMDIFDIISLLGGLAMFLYGMRLMGDSLKENSSGTLKNILSKVTDNSCKAFLLGVAVTALIQSSTATIVITAGLVGAGILTLRQSLGIIIGANVGTTVTGQIIRLLDINASGLSILRFFQPSTLAPVTLIIGIIFIMGNFRQKDKVVGNILIGFGILFSGLLNMTHSVNALAESDFVEKLFLGLGDNPFLGYLSGAGVAFMLQSSSATIGILQAFSSTGMLSFKAIYAVIVGIYLGDCVTTAIVCSIGAKAEARRVGIVNILFNLSETVLVLLVVTVVHHLGLLDGLWERTVNSGTIANTNTIFNLGCALTLFPLLRVYEKLSRKIVRDEPSSKKTSEVEEALNPVFFATPALGLQSCYQVLCSLFDDARGNIDRAFKLLEHYDQGVYDALTKKEEEIDHLTDSVSRYAVEFFPHLTLAEHVSILDQYYKVTTEFERLGDHAVKLANNAATISGSNMNFSPAAQKELAVLKAATVNLLDEAGQTFRERSEESAIRIEPLAQVNKELIAHLKHSHLLRMGKGECDIYKDVIFTDLLVEFNRIAGVCSNIGVATMIRIHPELAEHEHRYYEQLQNSGNETFDAVYERAHDMYFSLLDTQPAVPTEE